MGKTHPTQEVTKKMMYTEFNNMMVERFGWSFPESVYKEIVEPVYMAVHEDKSEFVAYCGKKDLNGLEMLRANIHDVRCLAYQGNDINTIHATLVQRRVRNYENAKVNEVNSLEALKDRMVEYLIQKRADAVKEAEMFSDMAENRRQSRQFRKESAERAHRCESGLDVYDALVVDVLIGKMDIVFNVVGE